MGDSTMIMKTRYQQKGFTLVELAIVLVIVGVLLGGFIGTLVSRIENTRKSETIEELEDIKQAMMAYAFVNGNLPCPDCDIAVAGGCLAADLNDGLADFIVVGGSCKEGETAGNVPWATLGLGRSDAWGTRYRYIVQNEYTNNTVAFTLNGVTGPVGFATIVEPDFAADATGAVPQTLANNIVAVIMSQGKNGFGGISEDNVARVAVPAANLDEANNTDNNATFYMRPETSSDSTIAGGEFDDIVIWISEYELKAKMVEAGALP